MLCGVRLYSFSYRELMLFEHLEDLDISHTELDVKLPPLLFPEPAGSAPGPRITSQGLHPISGEDPRGITCPDTTYDTPMFAPVLRRLTAVSTRLWNKWDMSLFPRLVALEISWAGSVLLEELHRRAENGPSLTELSICDVCLRNLVRATNFHKLAYAVGSLSVFRLRRVDVVKHVSQFAYLRAVLARLESLQVLELTGVSLDDDMLAVIKECLPKALWHTANAPGYIHTPCPPPCQHSSGCAGSCNSSSISSGNELHSEKRGEGDFIAPPCADDRDGSKGTALDALEPRGCGGLKALILGECGLVTEKGFKDFFS
ncbi:unnamed protein product, partial [Choristocarpus tenellus]